MLAGVAEERQTWGRGVGRGVSQFVSSREASRGRGEGGRCAVCISGQYTGIINSRRARNIYYVWSSRGVT